MAKLVGILGFPLGGEGLTGGKPWITNLVPAANATHVSLLDPVRLTFRDAESYIDSSQLLVEVGYAKVHAYADSVDAFINLPRTRLVSIKAGAISSTADITLTDDGLRIARTSVTPQKSVYATSIDAGSGYPSAMISGVLRPETLTSNLNLSRGPLNQSVTPGPLMPLPYSTVFAQFASGTVLGLEYGPRNKAAYLFLSVIGNSNYLELTSYQQDTGEPIMSLTMPYDWQAGYQRYTMVWNEAYGYVEVYADNRGVTSRLFRVPILSLPDMPEHYFARFSTARDIVGLYGQEGESGDSSIWKNIALTKDVGYPILGNIRPGTFNTQVLGTELLKTLGTQDPRTLSVGCWLTPPSTLFASPDALAKGSAASGVFQMYKPTSLSSFALYREEPGLLRSDNDGFMVQARMSARPKKQDGACTGVGFVVYDGRSFFQVMLFNDFANKNIGLAKKDAKDSDATQYLLPSPVIDWSKSAFRFVVDPRSNRVKFYSLDDTTHPVLDTVFSREALPSTEDKGLAGVTPFVAFGYISATSDVTGTLDFQELTLCHLYQEWEARSGEPPDGNTNPKFTKLLYGGASDAMGEVYQISTPPLGVAKIHRPVPFSVNRGGIIEAKVRITDFKTRTRSGVYLILDDGNNAYALTFVDTNIGKFVCLSLRSGLGTFQEVVGRDGEGAALSFFCDWTEFHTYRIERRHRAGIWVFIDNEADPRIHLPEAEIHKLPEQQFEGIPSVAIGHFTGDIATSEWLFVRGFFSGGFEVSFKKNKSDAVLRQELFGTQAIVIAYAEDMDA